MIGHYTTGLLHQTSVKGFKYLTDMQKSMEEQHLEELSEEKPPWWHGPTKIVVALLLVGLMIGWYFPYYNIKYNPSPKNIPTWADLERFYGDAEIGDYERTNKIRDATSFIDPTNPTIKQIATFIASQSCKGNPLCTSKALYYFVRDNLNYVSDPAAQEYIEPPVEILQTGGGDCESGSLLLANLHESVGLRTSLVLVPRHAIIRVFLPDAPKRFRHGDWVYLDWTCSNCEYGELAPNVLAEI